MFLVFSASLVFFFLYSNCAFGLIAINLNNSTCHCCNNVHHCIFFFGYLCLFCTYMLSFALEIWLHYLLYPSLCICCISSVCTVVYSVSSPLLLHFLFVLSFQVFCFSLVAVLDMQHCSLQYCALTCANVPAHSLIRQFGQWFWTVRCITLCELLSCQSCLL